MKNGGTVLAIVLVVLLGFAAWGGMGHQGGAATGQPPSNGLGEVAKQSWRYSQSTDQMTGNVSQSACLSSGDKLNFPFPYEGGSTSELCFLKGEAKNKYLSSFQIDKGQIVCPEECHVTMKVDDGQPITLEGSSPSDGSANFIFLDSYRSELDGVERIETSMRGAKVIKLEVEYYQQGHQVLTFEPDKPLDSTW